MGHYRRDGAAVADSLSHASSGSRRGRRGILARLAGALLLLGATLGSAGAMAAPSSGSASWLRYHNDASNNAVFAGPAQASVSWRSPALRDSIIGVSVVGDTTYAVGVGKTHGVYALNRANGQLIWNRRLDNQVMSQPIVVHGRVFVGTGNAYFREYPVRHWSTVVRGTESNSIYALDAASGRVLWRLRLPGEAMPTPLYRNGMLYWVTGDRRFLALDAASGRIAWSLNLPSYMSMSSPVEDGNLLIFGGAHPYAEYAVDIARRRVAWQHPFTTFGGWPVTGAVDDCSAALYGHIVFCTATTSTAAVPPAGAQVHGFAWALDARTGRLLWQYDQGMGKLPPFFAAGVPAVTGSVVYIESPGSPRIQALDARTGRLLWSATLAAPGSSAPLLDGHLLLRADNKGTLYAFDARNGTLLHRMHLGGVIHNIGLVLDGGTLYVPNKAAGVVDAMPESVLSAAATLNVVPPHGPVTVKRGTAS